jgi:tetratricopeptide (TPR) repeat protein
MVEAYHAGNLPYQSLLDLIKLAVIVHDTATRSSAAREYIHKYLNLLPDSAWKNKENVEALGYISSYLHSEDQAFQRIRQESKMIDSVTDNKGFASAYIQGVIYKEEIEPAVISAEKLGIEPNWTNLYNRVGTKFNLDYANISVATGKFEWFLYKKDWENYSGAIIDQINAYGWNPKDDSTGLSFNQAAAEIFLNSNDPNKLSVAAEWMRSVVASLKGTGYMQGEFIDTRANLLYKLGKKEEAIALEEKAAKTYPEGKDITDNLQKMKEGKPTWPQR